MTPESQFDVKRNHWEITTPHPVPGRDLVDLVCTHSDLLPVLRRTGTEIANGQERMVIGVIMICGSVEPARADRPGVRPSAQVHGTGLPVGGTVE